jgi:hypothetical protein
MVISADKNQYSPPEYNVVKDVNSEIPLVLVTRLNNYVFNEELLSLDKYVLVNLGEFGWDFKWDYTPVFGTKDSNYSNLFPGEEWTKFNDFVKGNPPVLILQREILKRDVTDKIKPLSYPCYQPVYETHTREQFNARGIELMHYWGRSSEERMWFQGNAYNHATKAGIEIVDNLYYLQGFLNERKERIWVTVHIPHFARVDISQVLHINGMAKIALSMPGCGKHCFRDGEVPVNSVMVLQDNDVAFPFEWEHGVNCIRYKGVDPIPAIEEALKRDDLYDIYLKGLETIDKYRSHNYNKYIEQLIKEAL